MEIIMKDYNFDHFKEKDIYTWEEIISIIEELESENYSLKEELEDLQRDVEDNYRRLSIEEQIY